MRSRAYTRTTSPRKPRIVTVTGHGIRLKVWLRSLWIEDGFKSDSETRQRTLTRATAPLDRLLFLAGSGSLTVDALDWCAENDVPIAAADQSGRLRWTLLPGVGSGAWQAPLRRAQALAPFTNVGAEIARWLVERKIAGQRAVLRDLTPNLPVSIAADLSRALTEQASLFRRAATGSALRQIEADAADDYFSAWRGLPLHFAPPSYARTVPAHWRTFRRRGSPLNVGNRNAADPANALLNYGYALLEAEARIACHAAGLDPYLGIGLHADRESRASLVYDVMEPVRPVADRLVLTLLLSHAFRPGELWALRDGRCRLDQDLCARMWPWMPEFRRALGPVMTFVLGRLRGGPRYGYRHTFRLIEVRPEVQTRAPLGRKRWAREAAPPAFRAVNACRSCGVLLEGERPDRLYCDKCLPKRQREVGPQALARLRRERRDPMFSPETRRKIGRSNARRNQEAVQWERAHPGPHDLAEFTRAILPGLVHIPLRAMMRATGLSLRMCARIRKRERTPHPRHWPAFAQLAKGGEAMEHS